MEKTKLFGTAGIRGPYGKKVTAELVFDVCQAVGAIYSSKGILVGHDARTSSEALSQCACAALSLGGSPVFNVGLCSFPVIANLTLNKKHSVAIYITASHNPPSDNGIKVFRNGREFTEKEQEEVELKIVQDHERNVPINHVAWDKIIPQEEINETNLLYKKRILSELKFQGDGRKIILDCANGPMSNLAPELLTDFGLHVITINSHIDGHFPGRLAEPSPSNLSLLIELCKKEGCIGAAFDGDGDRIAIVDENGEFVELSRVNALLAKLMIEDYGTGKIIVSIDSSTTIDRTTEVLGGEVIRTKLGELHSKAEELLANGEKIIFAAEPWKPIFPHWGLWIDGLYGLCKFLKVIITRQTTVFEVMREIPDHIAERKAYVIEEGKAERVFTRCKESLKESLGGEEGKMLTIDGLRYDLVDGTWILIRKSGTEPKIRIYYESPLLERFKWIDGIVKELEKIIHAKE
ncbi:MAG: phosphoglucosamine mutase [Asgard group archaeon]|nr:phosphoglucosamine mutase [Asgard group archaeon]